MNSHRLMPTLALMLLLLPQTAAAYIDPGTGSLLVQGLIAGIAAASVAIRGYWHKIRAFFDRNKKPEPPGEADPKNPEGDG